MKAARKLYQYFLDLFRKEPLARTIASPGFVKALLPRSAFTKKGPGVRAALRDALMSMTPQQRQIAIDKDWEKGVLTTDDWRLHRYQMELVKKL